MALISEHLHSTVSALVLQELKAGQSTPMSDLYLAMMPDAVMDDGTMIEFKTSPTGRVPRYDTMTMHDLLIDPRREYYRSRVQAECRLGRVQTAELVEMDYSAIEQRILAHMSGELDAIGKRDMYAALYGGTTSTINAPETTFTLEMLNDAMERAGLWERPKPEPRYDWLSHFGMMVYRDRHRTIIDLETCS